jgi:hypothetical protein
MRRLLAFTALVCAVVAVGCGGGDDPTSVSADDQPGAASKPTPPPNLATASNGDGLSITTDKDDYQPGDTVWFTGAGWQPGDTLDIVLADEPVTHEPHTWWIPVNDVGGFRDSTYVVDVGDLGVTFTLTATSRSTPEQTLTVQFTDAALNSAIAFTLNGGTAALTVSAGATLNWSFTATCSNGGGANTCVNGGFSGPGALVSNGYLADIEQSTTAGFSPTPTVTVKALNQATAGGTGSATGSFLAPTTGGTYFFRARHPNQVGLLQGAISNNFGAQNSNVVQVTVDAAPVDNTPPVVSNVAVSPGLTNGAVNVTLTATVDDATTGNANIQSAAYNIDGGSPIAMTASDAAFDSPTENVTATIPAAVVAALSNGPHTICVQGTDAAGNTSLFSAANACATLTVDNVPPIVSSVSASPNPTNGIVALTLTASVSDATTGNSNLVSAAYSIDGGSPTAMTASDLTFNSATEGVTATISPPLAEGTYTLCVQGTDAAGNTSLFTAANACTTLIVDQTPPAISNFTVLPNPVAVNTPFTISATFTDALTKVTGAEYSLGGTAGPWSSLPNAGGSYDSQTENGSKTITLASPDVLDVCVRSTDQVGNTNQTNGTNAIQCIFLAVYDPTAGFVTGGGWIMSPQGAYVADPSLTGKATFGFVSKYLKGANVPTGNTEFQFHAGSLNFSSTTYEWLVVSQNGVRAQYKGYGTVNGQSGYGFLLTALDQSPDQFRIKIWNSETSAIVYDNRLGSADSSSDATGLSGGSIMIHVPKK